MVATIILAFVGALFVLMGFIIRKFKIANIIAGSDPNSIKDRVGLANWMGKCTVISGLLALFIASLNYLFPSSKSEIYSFIGFIIGFMLCIVVALAGSQKYYK
ncbi:DUF3784 domain-containing protein [Spirosoma sp. KNUC1025]|uniref:DUF3784 domain-containing protein n=1 Tax=Spirosoma sp. KNUC1025 TaxID=2894082 RepID=UPI0038704D60|nr:DUF3784 domain-containing protein [Spirosoma sp. KNUC1025]